MNKIMDKDLIKERSFKAPFNSLLKPAFFNLKVSSIHEQAYRSTAGSYGHDIYGKHNNSEYF